MFHLVLQRIFHKKWMVAALLIGNILLVAIAVSNPMYQAASRRHMLTDGFSNYLDENNVYPMVIKTTGRIRKAAGTSATAGLREFATHLGENIGVPVAEQICYRNLVTSNAKSLTLHDGLDSEQKMIVGSLERLPEHALILSGRMYEPGIGEDGFIEAVISQSAMIEMNLLVGEEIEFENVKDTDGNRLHVRVVGVFTNSSNDDIYWYDSPDTYKSALMIDSDLFVKLFMYKGAKKFQLNENYTSLLDYTAVRPEQVDNLITFSNDMVAAYKGVYTEIETPSYIPILEEFRGEENRISVTLAILQVPVIVLLCAFIFMISRQMLEMEESEIALLKSRGASKRQVLRMYLFQSLILSAVSFAAGLPLGILVCKILGASSAFLQFNARRVLSVEINGEVIIYGAAAMLVSMLMTLIPVFNRNRNSIVDVKRKRGRSDKPIWQKLYLDFIMLAVSLYGLYNFSNQQDEMLARVLSGKSLDPLLFLSSSLFILGAGMVSLRIHGLIVRLIYSAGKKHWKPAVYTSFLQLIRTRNKQAFIMVFLVLTVAFGLFNTTVARTILANAENNIDYVRGADIVVREYWKNNLAYLAIDPSAEVTFTEPDFGKYGQIRGAKAMTKVFSGSASVGVGGKSYNSGVLAIDTKSFGETTDLDRDLLKYDFRDYLNVLSRNSDAILMSSNYRDKLGLKVGDTVTYKMTSAYYTESVTGIIYGFFDYWPSYRPVSITILEDESVSTSENYMIVSHLSTLQEKVGVYPYDIWINMDGDTSGFYEFAENENIRISYVYDSGELKEDIATEPLFQGTNGILTMSFITILLICGIGYVIYWTLSIRSRELLFGIFRAMGMTRNEIIHMLFNEQAFTGLFGILFGLGIGWIASELYVPIIQIAYSASDRVLPLELITKNSDVVRLIAIVAVMFIICLAILIRQVFRMKISQALKLGED